MFLSLAARHFIFVLSLIASEWADGSSSIPIKLVQSIKGSGAESLVSNSHTPERIKYGS
jgi:hypothetical protein